MQVSSGLSGFNEFSTPKKGDSNSGIRKTL